VDGPGSGSCPVAGFNITGVETQCWDLTINFSVALFLFVISVGHTEVKFRVTADISVAINMTSPTCQAFQFPSRTQSR